jgi:hypothetical protein
MHDPTLCVHNNQLDIQSWASQIGDNHILQPNQLNNHGIDSWLWFSQGRVTINPSKGQHRLDGLEHRLYRLSQKSTQAFRLSGLHQGILAEVRLFTFRRSGRMEEEPPTWLISAILFACAWVDTCHPCNCMRSFHLEVACPSKRT